jgi:CBS domain-containing protein
MPDVKLPVNQLFAAPAVGGENCGTARIRGQDCPGVIPSAGANTFEAMTETTTISEILKGKGIQVWSVPPETTVYDAIRLMAEKNIGALVVTQGDRLIGIFSERDYTRRVILQGKSSKTTQVREVISGQVISVTPAHTIQNCLHLMTDHRIRHLPVVENGRLAGMVSIGDLVNAIISAQQSTIEQLQTYITGVPG